MCLDQDNVPKYLVFSDKRLLHCFSNNTAFFSCRSTSVCNVETALKKQNLTMSERLCDDVASAKSQDLGGLALA